MTYTGPTETGEIQSTVDEGSQRRQQAVSAADFPRVGRNDVCPCGSGKKYKFCHGKLT